MAEQEKQLLLIDLCARLPYGVKVRINTKKTYYTAIVCEITRNYICVEGGGEIYFSHGSYKPYLRSMSSMTEEEYKEYRVLNDLITIDGALIIDATQIDWYNAHHFDYRGLIEKGLALEAPKGMYNSKTICNNCEDKIYCSQSEHVKSNCYKLK